MKVQFGLRLHVVEMQEILEGRDRMGGANALFAIRIGTPLHGICTSCIAYFLTTVTMASEMTKVPLSSTHLLLGKFNAACHGMPSTQAGGGGWWLSLFFCVCSRTFLQCARCGQARRAASSRRIDRWKKKGK